MVLVMLSTTVSMYAGIGDTIRRQYYHQMTISAYYGVDGENVKVPLEDLKQMVEQTADEYGLSISYTEQQQYLSCAVSLEGAPFDVDRAELLGSMVSEVWFMTADEYERLTGQTISLKENELAYYGLPGNASDFPDTFTLGDTTYRCLPILTEYPVSMESYAIVGCFGFVVPQESDLEEIYALQKEAYGTYASEMSNKLVLDFSDEDRMEEVYDDFYKSLRAKILAYIAAIPGANDGSTYSVDSKWDTIEYLYGMYGTLLFLGILLSIIFIFATALIIYYKQISEGYEDRERFFIMQKVGMSQSEVKGAIKSQILLVFFLPLLVAAVHTAFAFPILTRLLRVLFSADQRLFLLCTLASLAVFLVLYVLIYRVTARTYYKLVRRL
jgi:putative ABC transport system permease protein